MNGIENVIARIKAESAAECEDIAQKSVEDCERIRAEYAQAEQDEYWKYLGAGAKDTEKRLEQLNDLAAQESKKQVLVTQQEMVEAAFALAAEKLRKLPGDEYQAILLRLNMKADASPSALLAKYKEKLSPSVLAALFD